jgi:hypothetical protein
MKFVKENIYILLIIAAAAGAVFCVSPRGNFPLNDDWVYAYSVKHLFDTGHFRLSEWVAPSIVSHVLWGWLWCKAFGFFSFTVLRLSTLFLSIAGTLAFYFLLIKCEYSRESSFLGNIILFFNPFWFVLSYTFMTDVTYLSVCVMSTYLYYTGIKQEKESFLLAGSLFAAIAYLMRQLGVVIPFSVILYLYLFKKLTLRKIIMVCAAVVIAALAHRYWLKYIHGYTWAYIRGEDMKIDLGEFFPRLLGSLFYVGLFTLPLTASIYLKRRDMKIKRHFPAALAGVLAGFAMFLYVSAKGQFPFFENVINVFGLGTITLPQAVAKSRGVLENPVFWKSVTLAAGFSAAYFIYVFVERMVLNRDFFRRTGLFILVFGLQFAAAASRYKFFDRYTLLLAPLAIILCLEFYSGMDEKHLFSKYKLTSIALCMLFAVYSIAGTADYLSWSGAKWRAGQELVKMGYHESEIANGFDWNGWFTFEENMKKIESYKPVKTIGEWDWQSLNKYRCVVSFSEPAEGQGKEILRVPYKTPFSGQWPAGQSSGQSPSGESKGDNFVYAWGS